MMTGDKADQARHGGAARPYPPSWADRHKLWVARLPGPSWLYYLHSLVGRVEAAREGLTQQELRFFLRMQRVYEGVIASV